MSYGSGNSGNYKKLKGQMIQVTDTDPVVYAGAWSSGGNLNQGRLGMMSSGGGTLTAGLVFGGYKNNNQIYALNPDGTQVDGFPIDIGDKTLARKHAPMPDLSN